MIESFTNLLCSDTYLGSVANLSSAAANAKHQSARVPKESAVESSSRVLIVEFRDEIYVSLKSVFEEYGCEVARAASGATVANQVNRFVPDLILVNEKMPDESGLLVAGKLHVVNQFQTVWLYAARKPQFDVDWQELCGVDEILAYGGVLSRLNWQIRKHFHRRLAVGHPPFHERMIRVAG